jgi:probable DNA metabolism protein
MTTIDQLRAGQPLLVDTFAEWREAARELLVHDVPPEAVTWGSPQTRAATCSRVRRRRPGRRIIRPTYRRSPPRHAMPAAHSRARLMDMLQSAACCRVPDRWAFLYRVIWRWQQGEHDVQSPADEDGARLNAMVKAVRREEHDMHAYIRFRERPAEAGPPRFVAWYEPQHDVLPQVAEHFVSRMGKVSWMIATPEASVLWDGQTLHNTGPLVKNSDDLEDTGEALWLTYYRSVFNPARLNQG